MIQPVTLLLRDGAMITAGQHHNAEVRLIQTLIETWWLLALCGVFDAIISVIYAILYDADGPLAFPAWEGTIMFLNRITLAAGVCTIAAGILRSATGKSWLLVLNGLALSAYGLIPLVWRGPLSFLLFARLLVLMATTIGILQLVTARTLRRQRHVADGWFLGSAGAASFGFALAFLALVFGWIQLERRPFHPSVFLWIAFYFGFSAICMLWLGLRLHRLGPFQSRQWEASPPLGNPKHAH